MSINHLKTPMGRSLDKISHAKAIDAVHLTGKALPCTVTEVNGTLVTVNFDVSGFTLPEIEVPTAQSKYARIPIQIGDTGECLPADARIGGITGMGGPATADLSAPGNLSALTFYPISSTAFPAVDPNAVTMTGPNGIVMQDTEKQCVWTQTPSGALLKIGTTTFAFSASGLVVTAGGVVTTITSAGVHSDGDVTASPLGTSLITHGHPSNGAPPTPGS
jgi:hypothetical protein